MSLSSGEWRLSGGQNIRDTHCLISIIRIRTAFRLVVMDIGGGGVDVRSVTLDLGNDGVGARSIMADVGNDVVCIWDIVMNFGTSSVDIRNVMMSVRNGCMCVFHKFSLEAGG